jgi:hypothetical protein
MRLPDNMPFSLMACSATCVWPAASAIHSDAWSTKLDYAVIETSILKVLPRRSTAQAMRVASLLVSPALRRGAPSHKRDSRWGGCRMRYLASEKLEIIRFVEESTLPVRRTLEKIGIPASVF